MRYSDELEINGRRFHVEASTGADSDCSLTVRADDVGEGAVEVHGTLPRADLAMVGEVVQRSLSGLAQLASGSGPSVAGQRFKLRMAEDRRKYPKAWTAWSTDDDTRLLDGYRSGLDVNQLATELGRKPRAILSRLVKHGVAGTAAAD
jgi:hypothetical protein